MQCEERRFGGRGFPGIGADDEGKDYRRGNHDSGIKRQACQQHTHVAQQTLLQYSMITLFHHLPSAPPISHSN
jgi:hypothetical protein